MKASRWIIVALLIVAVVCFFAFDLGEYLTLESIKAHSGALKAKVRIIHGGLLGCSSLFTRRLRRCRFPVRWC